MNLNKSDAMLLPNYAADHDKAALIAIIDLALGRGYVVSVCDGAEWTVKKSADRVAILTALVSTDNDTLRFRDCHGEPVGSVWCIYGNGPGETFADYTDNPATENLVDGAYARAGLPQ